MRPGALWGLASAVAAAGGALVVTPYAIERIGIEQFGVLLLILAVSSYASALDLGLTWAASQFFSADLARGDADALAARFGTLSVLFLALGIVAVLLGLAATPAPYAIVVGLAACSFALSLQMGLLNALLHAGQWFTDAGRVLFTMSVLTPLAACLALRLQPDLVTVVAVGLLVHIIGLTVQVLLAARRRPFALRRIRWDASRLREMLSFGGWSSVGKGISMAMLHLDRVAVALAGSVSGVAFYATPANLAARVNLLGGFTTAQYFAIASRLHATGEREALSRHHARARRFLVCGTLSVALPLAILGPAFLEVWIGPEMAAVGAPVLLMLTVGNACVGITCIDAALLDASGRPHVTTLAIAGWGVIGAATAAFFHDSLGALGIAMAVAVWLAGVGATTAAIAHRRVVGGQPGGTLALAIRATAITGFAALVSALIVPEFANVISAVLAMGACASGVLALGFLMILRPDDRQLVLSWS